MKTLTFIISILTLVMTTAVFAETGSLLDYCKSNKLELTAEKNISVPAEEAIILQYGQQYTKTVASFAYCTLNNASGKSVEIPKSSTISVLSAQLSDDNLSVIVRIAENESLYFNCFTRKYSPNLSLKDFYRTMNLVFTNDELTSKFNMREAIPGIDYSSSSGCNTGGG